MPEIDIKQILDNEGPDRVVDSDFLREKYKNEKKPEIMRFGLGRLDTLMDGVCPGELIAIGGATKNGKTLLAQTITRNLYEEGWKSLWFTFEVPVPQFLDQMPPEIVFYGPNELKSKNLTWLMHRVFEAVHKYKVKAIFIDNLHHLLDLSGGNNISLEIGSTIRFLKRLAISEGAAIFILCHSKKPSDFKGGDGMSEFDLRDSSFIPQECDATLMIKRKRILIKQDDGSFKELEQCGNKSVVKVCNHRRTGVMNETVYLIKNGKLLEEDVINELRKG